MEQETIEKELRRLEEQELEEAKKLSAYNNVVSSQKQKPYWFHDLLMMGFSEDQIWFAIEIKGYDP